jgi:hypothetical protein
MTTTEKLLPCAHCNKIDSVELMTGAEVDESSGREPAKEISYVAICSTWSGGCGATGGYGETEDAARKKWNQRTHIPISKAIEAIRHTASCEQAIKALESLSK